MDLALEPPSDSESRPVRTPRRPFPLAAAAAVAALTLGACSDTNFGAQTNQPYQPGVGANVRGDVDVLNTLLVENPDGSATLSAGVVNQSDVEDAVIGVAATTLGGDILAVDKSATDVALPSEQLVPLGKSDGAGVYTVTGAPVGRYVRLTLTFATAPPAVVEAPVVTRGEYYDDIAVQ